MDWYFLGSSGEGAAEATRGSLGSSPYLRLAALLPLLDSEYRWRDGSLYRCNRQLVYWEVDKVGAGGTAFISQADIRFQVCPNPNRTS